MPLHEIWPLIMLLLASSTLAGAADTPRGDPLAAWRQGVFVRPVSDAQIRHSIHAYFNTTPESPDGRFVLFYCSATPNGELGELRIVERATGNQRVIASNITTEDAHRAACQQWASQGKRIVFHDLRGGHWLVAAIDTESGKERILARDRQVAWGQPQADVVPVYGCHWNPGEHRDLELVDLRNGSVTKVLSAGAVREMYPDWIAKRFGERPVSIFFPVLSPDLKRIFFKMASPGGGDYRSSKASQREGLIVYDLAQSRFLMMRETWGHPAWHPDSHQILEVGNLLIDTATAQAKRIANMPGFKGSHPSVSPDGKLFVTDCTEGGSEKSYAIVVGRIDGGDHVVIHRFDGSQGAKSWRRSHPHPVFSPDGRRIYFNVSDSPWTRLHVAEAGR
jgi:hypothetical protein